MVHPGLSTGYSRDKTYKAFGFDELYFSDNIPIIKRAYSTFRCDVDAYTKAEELLKENDKPVFMSLVTIEAHGGYDYHVPDDEKIHELSGMEDASIYATAEKDSLEALSSFINYLRKHSDEKTIVVFYGDHNPSLSAEKIDAYRVPFLIFSNFGKLGATDNVTIENLLPKALQAANQPLSAWEKYVLSLHGDSPDKDIALIRIKGLETDKD